MNAISTQLRDLILTSGLTRWRIAVAAAESGRNNPVSKHQIIQPESMENEQADAGRDGRNCLARLNSQAQTGTGTGK